MSGEHRIAELTSAKDGLLNSQVSQHTDFDNGALQSQWQVIRDGLVQGVGAQLEQAKDNSLTTGVSIAGSFGLGAGLGWALKAGGRWTTAAEAGAAMFTALMAGDLIHRGRAINDVYASTSGDTLQGQTQRRDAIANYAGRGIVDYSLMLGSGGLGAASAHFAPRISGALSTALEPLGQFGLLETAAAMQPVRASNFRVMNLGEHGNLGAKELPSASDPVSVARKHLEFPHKSVGLDELAALMEAKQLAAHPEVAPVFSRLSDTLARVDALKPELANHEQALGQAAKKLADVKSLKAELQAVRAAESSISSLNAEMQRIPSLREEQASLTRQIQEAKVARDGETAGDGAANVGSNGAAGIDAAARNAPGTNSVDDLKARRREITETIANIQAGAQELPGMQQRLAEARSNFSKRQAAIEAGADPQVKELEAQMLPLQESVDASRAQLASLTDELGNLNRDYSSKADSVRPGLKDAAPAALVPDLPGYARPGLAIDRANGVSSVTAKVSKVGATGDRAAAPPPLSIVDGDGKAASKLDGKTAAKLEKSAAGPAGNLNLVAKMLSDTDGKPVSITDGKPLSGTDAKPAKPERKDTLEVRDQVTTESDVNKAFRDAKQAVEDFFATHKRHTTALKKVNDYIEQAFNWFASDPAASARVSAVASSVDGMLAKLENWDRSPAWIRDADKDAIMQKNGFSPEDMSKYDQWFQTQNESFHDNGNMSPDRKLLEVRDHLSRRIRVESIKNWLRTAPDVKDSVSPIVQQGFNLMAEGLLPDGRPIPKGSDMIVFEKVNVKGPNGDQPAVLPFAKDGQHVQRFDDAKISAGLRKLNSINAGGPQALSPEDLYAFRLDHDPSRLTGAPEQVGYAILRPGGQYGKNIMYMQFSSDLDPALVPKSLRPDGANGASGTNTGVLYNMVKSAKRSGGARSNR